MWLLSHTESLQHSLSVITSKYFLRQSHFVVQKKQNQNQTRVILPAFGKCCFEAFLTQKWSLTVPGTLSAGGDGVYTPLLPLRAVAMVGFGEFQLKLHDKAQELVVPRALL